MEFQEKVTFGGVQGEVQREKFREGECREEKVTFGGVQREVQREKCREGECREAHSTL